MIEKFNLLIANSYLIRAARPVLVDTGAPASADRLLRLLQRAGVAPGDIGLILLTHAHSDHAGSAAALRRLTGAPVAVHPADQDMLRRGSNGTMLPVGLEARFSQPFVDRPFPGLEPDILLTDQSDLDRLGVPARLLHTPGHSPGSVSLVFEDGAAVIGDILRGGVMGGVALAGRPSYPYFLYNSADKAVLQRSVRAVLDAGATTLYCGHGGPLARPAVERWLAQQTAA